MRALLYVVFASLCATTSFAQQSPAVGTVLGVSSCDDAVRTTDDKWLPTPNFSVTIQGTNGPFSVRFQGDTVFTHTDPQKVWEYLEKNCKNH